MILKFNHDVPAFRKRLHQAALVALCLPMASFAGSTDVRFITANTGNDRFAVTSPLDINSPYQTITGKVTDSKNSPLQGVTVAVKGTKLGTVTALNGEFTLSNAPETGTLVFSSVGYANQ